MTWKTRCSACGHQSEAGKGYWHLMRCEPWLLAHRAPGFERERR